MAEAVLLAADQPQVSAGSYNCGDERQFTLAQWVEIIAAEMDWPLDIVPVPDAYASRLTVDRFMGPATTSYSILIS